MRPRTFCAVEGEYSGRPESWRWFRLIRTRGNPLRSRPSLPLALTSTLVVAIGCILPFAPLGATLGFVRPPAILFAVLAATVIVYLGAVQVVKSWFYRRAKLA